MKSTIFQPTRNIMGVKDLCNAIDGGQVSLVSVLAWCIREMRFNKLDNTNGN